MMSPKMKKIIAAIIAAILILAMVVPLALQGIMG
jgi:hypothetical protein